MKKRTLDQLNPGQIAEIDSITDEGMLLKLLEMGCLPGEKIKINLVAPLGDPIAVEVSGYTLSLRRSEASGILVLPIAE